MREIVFYKTEEGKSPVKIFLDLLTPKQAQKVTWVLQLVEELERVPRQFLKKLAGTKDLWEIRIKSGRVHIRLLCFFDRGDLVIITNGFTKKSNLLPLKEINLGEKRKRIFLKRKNK
jgi:phage-related protein